MTVTGAVHMPVGDLPRRMTVVRLYDGRLVIFSAMSLNDEQMGVLEAFGRPASLIVPGDHHRLDARAWKDRYPLMQVLTPAGACDTVSEVVHVDATAASFDDPTVAFITVAGTREHEAALRVNGRDGTTLVLNDLMANIHDATGFSGWLLKLMGFAGEQPSIPLPVKAAMIKDKEALRGQLRLWAADPTLRRIIVSHGSIIEEQPQEALHQLGESLH
jgi:hypothetical protein